MKTKQYLKVAATAFALPLIMSGCSKEQSLQPSAEVTTSGVGVSVSNGRLVFADIAAFDRIKKELMQKNNQGAQELDTWEKALHFTSLRTAAAAQSSHLEQMELTGQPTLAYKLMDSFGFPTFYATFINPNGEYQVGTKIYWFNDGYKHAVSSEAELQQIKQNPALSQDKSEAGSQLASSFAIKGQTQLGKTGKATTNAFQSNQLDCDDKYVSPTFNLNGDSGSQRRIIFGTHIYSTYEETVYGVAKWYSVLYMRSKVDYYSNGSSKWYSADGDNRQVQF